MEITFPFCITEKNPKIHTYLEKGILNPQIINTANGYKYLRWKVNTIKSFDKIISGLSFIIVFSDYMFPSLHILYFSFKDCIIQLVNIVWYWIKPFSFKSDIFDFSFLNFFFESCQHLSILTYSEIFTVGFENRVKRFFCKTVLETVLLYDIKETDFRGMLWIFDHFNSHCSLGTDSHSNVINYLKANNLI